MNIAIINTIRAYGGGEKWVVNTAEGLRARGHEVTILCHPGSGLHERATELGLAAFPVVIRSDVSFPSLMRVMRALRKVQPDVVICCNERAVRIGALAARLATRARVVYRNGLQGSFKNKQANRWVGTRCVDYFVTNAAATRDEMLDFGWVPADKTSVIYNGIDLGSLRAEGREALRREWGIPADGILAAAAARLVKDKGHADMLPALAPVAAAFPNLRVVIAGDGSERPNLEAKIREHGLEGCVRLLGFRNDVPAILAAADLLVHPSRKEGTPNVVMEAMAASLPVVATAACGTGELVVDGETGYVVPVGDAPALEQRLRTLLTDPTQRQAMGQAGRQRIEREFSQSRAVDRWEALLQSLGARS